MANLVTKYRCTECDKNFNTAKGLVQHARMKHDTKLPLEEAEASTVEVDYDVVRQKPKSLRERLGFTEFHPHYLVIGVLCVVVGGPLAWYITSRYERRADASRSWPSTTGEVLESKVKAPPAPSSSSSSSRHRTHVPVITYRYKVAGREYLGRRATIGKVQGRADSAKLVARFPAGAKVTVYYDPDDPAKAVLVRGMGGRNPIWVALPLALALGLIFIIAAFRKDDG